MSSSESDLTNIWKVSLTPDKLVFFCRALIKAIDACREGEYTRFDAHTTSNCCHGISLLVADLISSTADLNLAIIQELAEKKIVEIQNNHLGESGFFTSWVPEQLLALTSLYILAYVREIDSQKRIRTDARRLKEISTVGSTFCWEIINILKKHFSNFVVFRYQAYLNNLCHQINVSGIPVGTWGKYVKSEYIRTDKRDILYASCLFSTQLSLGYLIQSEGMVALVNDLVSTEGQFRGRYIRLLKGDGKDQLRPVNLRDFPRLSPASVLKPVVIFGGYLRSDSLSMASLERKMEPWIECFPRLMLACDLFYPQFPQVRDDPAFDSSPIVPEEARLRKVLYNHCRVKGVASFDPSLFCSSHTYPASLKQLLNASQEDKEFSLPTYFHEMPIENAAVHGGKMQAALAASLSEEPTLAPAR